jgi:hypothetical protein
VNQMGRVAMGTDLVGWTIEIIFAARTKRTKMK